MADTPDDVEYEDVTAYIAARRERTGPPPGFRLHGEVFTAHQKLRVAALLDFDVDMPKIGAPRACLAFLRGTLDNDSLPRFEAMFIDRDRPVDDEDLQRAVELLMAGYTGRPTQESSSSSATRSKRSRNSKGGSTPSRRST